MYFCIIKEKIAYMNSLCSVDSALVSDSNAYIGISNCIQMFELY